MQTEQKNGQHGLEEGQFWKVEHGHVYIVESGKRFVRYQMLRQPGAKAPAVQLIGIEALLNYLRQTEAHLVGGNIRPGAASVALAA